MSESKIPDISSVASPSPTDIDYTEIELIEKIGGGGQAVVHHAHIHGNGSVETVAVRAPPSVFESGKTGFQDEVRSFLRKAAEWKKVTRRERENPRWEDSDHIVGVLDIGEEVPWIAMEYMDGGDLSERLDGLGNSFGLEEALWTGERICRGIEVAHNEVDAHFDLKPKNVLFRQTADDFWDVPKVADWGAARSLKSECGSIDEFSPMYASPEILSPSEFGIPGTSSDIYQLGATIYTLLAGKPPYSGSKNIAFEIVSDETPPPPSDHVSAVPAVLDEAVLTALERHPGDRYESVAEFRTALKGIRTDGPLPPTLAKRLENTSRRTRSQSPRPSHSIAGQETNTEPSETDDRENPSSKSAPIDVFGSLTDRISSLEQGPIPDDIAAQVPYLVQALTDSNRQLRRRSVLVLEQITDIDSSVLTGHVEDLAAVLDPDCDRSNDERIRKHVASVLATLAEDHSVAPAVATCGRLLRREQNKTVREHAALTLLQQSLNHDPAPVSTCVEELIGALHDPVKQVRNRSSLVLLEVAILDSTHLTPYQKELENATSNKSDRVVRRVTSICERLPTETTS